MLNYWPTKDMDAYLNLENRVMARMALVDTAGSGSDDPFTEEDLKEGAQLELNFRDTQLMRLREETLDLEDLNDGVVMSDLTMDYFLAQLRHYLEQNKEELEATPDGAYAIAPDPPNGASVIFLLRQRNAATDDRRQRAASPIEPFYLVYIKDDGTIRYGCARARQSLEAFEKAAVGWTEPITGLCDWFDQETGHGKDMKRYDRLLDSVIAHIRQAYAGTQAKALSRDGARDFVLPKVSESPRDSNDFELITWLIVR